MPLMRLDLGAWTRVPAAADACDGVFHRGRRGDDGVFFMAWADFIAHFNKLYLCTVYGPEWHPVVLHVSTTCVCVWGVWVGD